LKAFCKPSPFLCGKCLKFGRFFPVIIMMKLIPGQNLEDDWTGTVGAIVG
jgi:hypothetical protein